MYAVVEDRGRQYRVREGDLIETDRMPGEAGKAVVFDRVVMVGEEDKLAVGTPHVAGAKVTGAIEKQVLGEKLLYIHRVRTNSLGRRRGHRAQRTQVRIQKIEKA